MKARVSLLGDTYIKSISKIMHTTYFIALDQNAFYKELCLFHHFYGLVCRHLLEGLSHLDLIEIMQPFPSPNVFFYPSDYINVPFVM